MTDAFTDELFQAHGVGGTVVQFPVSRLLVDPERFENDAQEVMAGRGIGVIYTRSTSGGALRRALQEPERQALLDRFYRPHHAALTEAAANELSATGRCLILDAHSFPAVPLPWELDQDPSRPDICIGTDSFHTPPALVNAATAACRDLGWTVEIDRPFSGALVPIAFHRRDAKVKSLMIEVNRRLYMDEATGTRGGDFEACRTQVGRLISGIVSKHRSAIS